MKKAAKLLIIVSMLILLVINTSAAPELSVAERNANTLVKLGIMKGYEDGSLRLDNKIKRSEFITLVVKMLAYDKDTDIGSIQVSFKDINQKHWAFSNIKLALKYDLVSGYPDNTIGPDKNVTYAEALAVVIRALGYEDTLEGSWPENVINKGSGLGLDKNLDLQANHQLTRGEMSIIVYNSLIVNFAVNQ